MFWGKKITKRYEKYAHHAFGLFKKKMVKIVKCPPTQNKIE